MTYIKHTRKVGENNKHTHASHTCNRIDVAVRVAVAAAAVRVVVVAGAARQNAAGRAPVSTRAAKQRRMASAER